MSIVTVESARSRLGLAATATHRDAEIQDLIDAAEGHVEDLSGHILERRQIRFGLIEDNGRAELFAWPIVKVDAIDYRASTGDPAAVDVDALTIVDNWRPAYIETAGGGWPGEGAANAVATVTAGYEAIGDVPPKLVQAVLVLVGQWFEDPTGERPISPHVKALCWAFRNAI